MSDPEVVESLDRSRCVWLLKQTRGSARAAITLLVTSFASPDWITGEDGGGAGPMLAKFRDHINVLTGFFNVAASLVNAPHEATFGTEEGETVQEDGLWGLCQIDRDCTDIITFLEQGGTYADSTEASESDGNATTEDESEADEDQEDDAAAITAPAPSDDDDEEGTDDEGDGGDETLPQIHDDDSGSGSDASGNDLQQILDEIENAQLPPSPIKRSASAGSARSTNFFGGVW